MTCSTTCAQTYKMESAGVWSEKLHLPSAEAASCMSCQGCGTTPAAAAAAVNEASGCTTSCPLPPDDGMPLPPCWLHCLNRCSEADAGMGMTLMQEALAALPSECTCCVCRGPAGVSQMNIDSAGGPSGCCHSVGPNRTGRLGLASSGCSCWACCAPAASAVPLMASAGPAVA